MRHIMKFYSLGPFRLIVRNRRIRNATSHIANKIVDGCQLIHAQIAKGKFSIALQYWQRSEESAEVEV